jgi:cytosine/adenosine deaminase-related metal-dependent hydrolase
MKPKKAPTLLVRGAHVLTMDDAGRVGRLDVRIEGNRIAAVGERLPTRGVDETLDAKGLWAIPGLVQAHVHLCQTLFRGQAEDLDLLTWLSERIWPLEGALGADDVRAATRLGTAELLLSGTTSVLDVGTVQHSDVLFEEAERLGLRYTGGKAVMDHGQGYPAALRESGGTALAESVRLCERWHGAAQGRLRYAFSPRFVLACTDDVLRACVREARARGALLQTDAAESNEEVELVRERTGAGPVAHLHGLGFSGRDVILAHGVWLAADERRILRETGTRLVHCPSSNLKLASGIARMGELLDEGVALALGADGAACNNNLDGFLEMRLTALIHRARGGPGAIPARTALRLATHDGAQALGLDAGVIEPGKLADLVLLDLDKPHAAPNGGDPYARVVFAAKSSDVHTVIVDGRVVVREGRLLTGETARIVRDAEKAANRVRQRLG